MYLVGDGDSFFMIIIIIAMFFLETSYGPA